MATFDPIEIEKALKGVDYPASREDLLDTAEEYGASKEIISQLESIPEKQYEDPTDIMTALGHADDAIPTEDAVVPVDPDDEDDDLSGLGSDI